MRAITCHICTSSPRHMPVTLYVRACPYISIQTVTKNTNPLPCRSSDSSNNTLIGRSVYMLSRDHLVISVLECAWDGHRPMMPLSLIQLHQSGAFKKWEIGNWC